MLNTHGYFDPVPQLGKTDTGGQVVYVLQLSKALAALQVKVDIYTRWFSASKKQIDPVPDCPDVRIIRIPSGPWEFIAKEEIYELLPEITRNMIDFIKGQKINYDLFHGHYVDAGIVTLDVAGVFGKPDFFTAHSLGEWKREKMGGDPEEMERKFKFSHRKAEELRIFNSVKAHTVTSSVQEEKLRELYGIEADNIEILSPGVDLHTYRPLESDDTKGKTKKDIPDKYIFCLSRIDTNKGHDLLLDAFDILGKTQPDVHLVIGGGSPNPQRRESDLLAKIKEIIDTKGLQGRVHIIGYVSDDELPVLYQRAQMFVLPSIFEPFGMTSLEAMACAIPVIASGRGGIRSVITSGENGLLIDPGDSNEFAEAMLTILKDRQFAEKIGKAGHQAIQKHYSWEAIARKHIAFYQRYM